MDDYNFKLFIYEALKDITYMKIDILAIINILIDKNIVSLNEINKYKEDIKPIYSNQLYQIQKMIDIESINNNAEFRSELERKLNNVIIPTEELKIL